MGTDGKKCVTVELDEQTSGLLLKRIRLLERRFGKAIDVGDFVTQIVRHKILARYRDPDPPVKPAEVQILEEARKLEDVTPELESLGNRPTIDDADPM